MSKIENTEIDYMDEEKFIVKPKSCKSISNTLSLEETIKPDIPFWTDNPNILLKQEYMFEFFPTEYMTYEQKMNAITRLVIILTVFGFVYSKNHRLLAISFITLVSIYLIYQNQRYENDKMAIKKMNLEDGLENFTNNISGPAQQALNDSRIITKDPTEVFDSPAVNNPFSNVLLTDYDYNPNKKPAAPSYNDSVQQDILGQAKQLVSDMHPDQPDISDKLFSGIGDRLEFEQSMRQFISNPSTTIPNDQTAFAQYCFGNAISAKEGNLFALARNLNRHVM
jgi:hypothetical protein